MKSTARENHQLFEIIALILSGAAKFLVMDWLGMRVFFIAGISLFWIIYIWYKVSRNPPILEYWGFRKKYLGKSLAVLMSFFIISLVIMVMQAREQHISLLNPNILPLLFLYPIWGIIQQFLMVCIVAEFISKSLEDAIKPMGVLVITAFFFCLIHIPDLSLMVYTFVMEIVFLMAYNRWRNIWALGLVHGWTGTFLLYYVMGRDLWIEMFIWF